ncbi:MAG: hypothetical protein MMC33_001674 [Icmadophila ericetorum]|nr:hypothetical protein [Icmadophila ericetorum]
MSHRSSRSGSSYSSRPIIPYDRLDTISERSEGSRSTLSSYAPSVQSSYGASHCDGYDRASGIQSRRFYDAPSTRSSHSIYDNVKDDDPYRRLASKVNKKRAVQGLAHPETLQAIADLSVYMFNQNRYEDVEDLLESTLKSFKRTYGEDHHATLVTIDLLAKSQHEQGNYGAAAENYKIALDLKSRKFGTDHEDTLRAMNTYAVSLTNKGEYEAAEVMFRQVLECRERVLGRKHHLTIDTRNILMKIFSDYSASATDADSIGSARSHTGRYSHAPLSSGSRGRSRTPRLVY